MNTREYSELQKLYSNIINEYDEAKSAASAEKNLLHSFNKPGSQAPGYKYSGRMAPNRNGSGQVPEQKRVQQDLKAATQRSQQRQLQMNFYDPFEIIKNHLLDEGYVNDEKSAFAIMANMSESWKQSILEMDDFAAGGGNAKMKKTGMTRDQVVALGKKNLAAKPASSSSYSKYKSASSSSTSSKPSSPSTSSKPSSTVTARDKFNAHRDARYRADNVASSYGLNRKDPATNAKLKQWADTNYRQNIAIKGNDPNYDPTKTSYPEFTPAKKSAKDAWKNL